MNATTEIQQRITVVVPARLEAATIDGSLNALHASVTWRLLDVHIVCNGPFDDTAQRACVWIGRFAERGWSLTIHQTDLVGKPAALRFGAQLRTGGGFLLLDARVRVHPEAIEQIVAATEASDLLLVSGQPHYVPTGGWLSRSFSRGYAASPFARSHDLKGTCMYFAPTIVDALDTLPDCGAEDRYFVSVVKRSQRASVLSARVDYSFPDRARNLLRQQIRWVSINQDTERLLDDYERSDHENNRRPYFGPSPPPIRDRFLYIVVAALARALAAVRRPSGAAW